MAKCGWCKKSGLTVYNATRVDPVTDSIVRTGDSVLETHTIPVTASTVCNGPETYRDMDSNGRPGRH